MLYLIRKKNPIGTLKRPLIVSTSSPSSPTLSPTISPKIPEPITPLIKNTKNKQKIKKPKIRSRSTSSTRKETNIDETLEPARETLSKNDASIKNI